MPAATISRPTTSPTPKPHDDVRQKVKELLYDRTPAFRAMSADAQEEIARNTALVADYLARPEGLNVRRSAPQARALDTFDDTSGREATWQEKQAAVDAVGGGKFSADAAREGAAVAGLLLNEVQFPTFVSGLISGVFQSITHSSIEQMEAYQKMIAAVATSLSQFMSDHVDENQGRQNMVAQFPDLFEIGTDDFDDNPTDRLKLKDGVDEDAALKRVNNKLEFENGALKSLDLSDANVQNALVENSRLELARQRQQLMASIVLMGINRIVVTDGKISAKIIYDVKATDKMARRRSAAAMDYARNQYGTVQTTYDSSYQPPPQTGSSSSGTSSDQYSAGYYASGQYQNEDKPIITAQTAASESDQATLQTKIQLSGSVDVNFKSDYLPLDKMATPQMIAAIQGNAAPGPGPRGAPAPAAAPSPGSAAAAQPATGAATAAPPAGTIAAAPPATGSVAAPTPAA
jgi:hypothetical protein